MVLEDMIMSSALRCVQCLTTRVDKRNYIFGNEMDYKVFYQVR
jgi:hypothetical protein